MSLTAQNDRARIINISVWTLSVCKHHPNKEIPKPYVTCVIVTLPNQIASIVYTRNRHTKNSSTHTAQQAIVIIMTTRKKTTQQHVDESNKSTILSLNS